MSKYGVFSGPYFRVFRPIIGKHEPEKKSVFGYFARSVLGVCTLAQTDFKPYLEHKESLANRAYSVKLNPVKTSVIFTSFPGKQIPQNVVKFYLVSTAIRDHLFSACKKFTEKLTFRNL